MREKILLSRRERGTIVQASCFMKVLEPGDEKEACAFYSKIARVISDPEIFVSDNTIPDDINGSGIVLGVYDSFGLICIRVLTHGTEALAHYGDSFSADELKNAVCSDGCVVDSSYRGNNLQVMTWFRLEPLVSEKYEFSIATVSPKNIFSLKNMLACGFFITSKAEMYGGKKRFVMRKNFNCSTIIETSPHIEIDIHDEQSLSKMLEAQYVGYKLRHRSTGIKILLGSSKNSGR